MRLHAHSKCPNLAHRTFSRLGQWVVFFERSVGQIPVRAGKFRSSWRRLFWEMRRENKIIGTRNETTNQINHLVSTLISIRLGGNARNVEWQEDKTKLSSAPVTGADGWLFRRTLL